MKTRWLVVLACLLVTACSTPEVSETEPTKKPDAAKTDPKPESKPDSVKEVEAAPEKSAAKKDSIPATIIETKPAVETDTKPVDEKVAETKPGSREEQAEALVKKYASAMIAFQGAYRAAAPEDRNQVRTDTFPKSEEYAKKFMALVADNSDDDAAFTSLKWIATNVRGTDMVEKANTLLFEKHLDKEGLKDICLGFSRAMPSAQVSERLDLLIDKSPHDSVKGLATYAKAKYLGQFDRLKTHIESNPDTHGIPKDTVAFVESADASPEVIEALYQSLLENYAEIPIGRRTVKEVAEGALFEIRKLAIGMEVPDIENVDLDGTTFKLSDYRGKIVLIDFWGDW